MESLFKALNDATRRALLDSLSRKDGQTLQELEETADMTRFGIMKHLKVLEDAGLIVPVKKGRFKYHYLNAVPLQEAIDRWIDPLLAKPAARAVLDLKAKLEGEGAMLEDPQLAAAEAKPDFLSQTYIRCTQDALWDAITDPDAVQHYHFMAAGAQMRDGKTVMLMADGSPLMSCAVLESTPKTRAVTTFEPHWDPAIKPSRVVYTIEVEGAYCRLTIAHYGLTHGSDGVADGWARWVAGLKTWLETGQDAHFGSRAEQV